MEDRDMTVRAAKFRRPFVSRRPNPVFSDEYRSIIAVIVQARRVSGLSQKALADRIGKTPSHICMIERGQRRVDMLEFCLIARSLGMPPTMLFEQVSDALDALSGSPG